MVNGGSVKKNPFFLCDRIKYLGGILEQHDKLALISSSVSEYVVVFFLAVGCLKRITCSQLISLIIKPIQCAAILKLTVLRVEVSFYLQCGSNFPGSLANNDVFM